MHPNSRFKPYINTWPQPEEVVNQHNLDPQYWRMLKSPYWERELLKWLRSAQALAEGTWDPALPLTIPEAVGHVAVSQADVEHVSAIIASRSLGVFGRNLSLLVPLVDMANHAPACPHYLSAYDGRRYLDLIAGAPIKAGQEVCYDYGDLRDDYAVAHYGFLPDLRGQPPRLSLVDHPGFDPAARHTPNSLPDTPFAGSPAEVEREVGRLLQIHLAITSTPADLLPAETKGQWVYGMLKELESRRLRAIEAEVTRLARELDAASPGSVLDWEEGRGAKAVRTVCVGSNCWRTLPGGRWEVWVPEGGGKTEL
ncbi:hypothetical protein HYH03_016522 [Edaphochlamys debaryana]|uniref:SET domain-containing protein n=1 Tax=Edaphochlamys debaryana TaxID=47281 RepID=A0A836BRI9_9CHLO|nr:hypothetical protein HYH03_016522 [Edaphochlamys debaryana]|eukprot:KAG2484693.1 hypothetical protein HYH03_016522 [Edaphochlamys debaryana]